MRRLSEVENDVALDFLMKNKVYKEHISISNADKWVAAIEDSKIIGIIGLLNFKNKARIKAFYVLPEKRGQGIGTRLLLGILPRDKLTSTFATKQSRSLFEKQGFKIIRENENNICFMERGKD